MDEIYVDVGCSQSVTAIDRLDGVLLFTCCPISYFLF